MPNVAYDGSTYWLITGGAALVAALDLRMVKIPVTVHMGDQQDAQRLARKWAAGSQEPTSG